MNAIGVSLNPAFDGIKLDKGGSKMSAVGKTIRMNRTWKGISSSQLAKKAKISASYLSKVETNKVNPSLAILSAIADALEIQLDELFRSDGHSAEMVTNEPRRRSLVPTVVRSKERKLMKPANSGVVYQLLTPDLQRNLQFILVRHEPGEKDITFSHEGEESVYCLEGSLRINIGDDCYSLEPGDCISFDSSIPHSVSAYGDHAATIICAQTPPSF